jgi:toxin YoeB
MGESERVRESKYALIFTDQALDDLAFHRKVGNRATVKRIGRILEELETTPFTGIGNPHELAYNFSGRWSRHLNKKDVVVYEVSETEMTVYVISARYHYLEK